MATSLLGRAAKRRIILGSAAVGVVVYTGNRYGAELLDAPANASEAVVQFNTSYGYAPDGKQLIKPPEGCEGPFFQLRNDYPKLPTSNMVGAEIATRDGRAILPTPGEGVPTDPDAEKPWMKVDFKVNPEKYCAVVKEYCYEGNVNNGFVVQKNRIRDWYHAPWMHYNKTGREPLNGLTFERPTPPFELSETQPTYLQTWAIGFYNHAGATSFGQIWKDPNAPKWGPFKFPEGTAVFKILMTNATDQEVPSMVGAPSMKAVIAVQPDRTKGVKDPGKRNEHASELRLLQMDFAVQDHRSEVGWVFGTFMYDGSQKAKDPWDRIIPVGLMWGNDPNLTPELYKQGSKPQESWINPVADELRNKLKGTRPYWGFDGRLNGPADNFKSACMSCHSTSQWPKHSGILPPEGASESTLMRWFRNLKAGEPFDEGSVSGDYSLQLSAGYANYDAWSRRNPGFFHRTMLKIPFTEAAKHDARVEKKRNELRDV